MITKVNVENFDILDFRHFELRRKKNIQKLAKYIDLKPERDDICNCKYECVPTDTK